NQQLKSNETIDGLKSLISCVDVYLDTELIVNKKSINKYTEVQLFETAKLYDLKGCPSDNGNCYG
ncbi:230_t:CDS:2, partial [Entrophospora sp. SA101]